MQNVFSKFLTTPLFKSDDDKTRIAALLNIVLLLLMGTILLGVSTFLLGTTPEAPLGLPEIYETPDEQVVRKNSRGRK